MMRRVRRLRWVRGRSWGWSWWWRTLHCDSEVRSTSRAIEGHSVCVDGKVGQATLEGCGKGLITRKNERICPEVRIASEVKYRASKGRDTGSKGILHWLVDVIKGENVCAWHIGGIILTQIVSDSDCVVSSCVYRNGIIKCAITRLTIRGECWVIVALYAACSIGGEHHATLNLRWSDTRRNYVLDVARAVSRERVQANVELDKTFFVETQGVVSQVSDREAISKGACSSWLGIKDGTLKIVKVLLDIWSKRNLNIVGRIPDPLYDTSTGKLGIIFRNTSEIEERKCYKVVCVWTLVNNSCCMIKCAQTFSANL